MAVRNIMPVDRVAALLRDRLAGHNLRVSSHGAVHRTRDARWLRGETIPGPACGVAVGQLDPAQWSATIEAVTCLHCLRSVPTALHSFAHHRSGQLALFDPAA